MFPMPAQPANHAGAAGHVPDAGAAGHVPDAGEAGHVPDAGEAGHARPVLALAALAALAAPRQILPTPPTPHPRLCDGVARAATNTVSHPLHPLCKTSYTTHPPTKAKRAPIPLLQKFRKTFV